MLWVRFVIFGKWQLLWGKSGSWPWLSTTEPHLWETCRDYHLLYLWRGPYHKSHFQYETSIQNREFVVYASLALLEKQISKKCYQSWRSLVPWPSVLFFVDSIFWGSINYIDWSNLRRSRQALLNLAKPELELACLTSQPIEKFKSEEKLGWGLVW